MTNIVPTQQQQTAVIVPGFGSAAAFELLERQARHFANSDLVPVQYRSVVADKKGNRTENPAAVANLMIALEMAHRCAANPLMVLQNLAIIEGKPSWSAQWIIAQINSCGRYAPLRFEIKTDDVERKIEYSTWEWEAGQRVKRNGAISIRNITCVAWTIERATGERIEGMPVSLEMAIRDGWYHRNGSKWQTIPDLMLRYRAAAFFGRLYCPELLMGLPMDDEVRELREIAGESESFAPGALPGTVAGEVIRKGNEFMPSEKSTAVEIIGGGGGGGNGGGQTVMANISGSAGGGCGGTVVDRETGEVLQQEPTTTAVANSTTQQQPAAAPSSAAPATTAPTGKVITANMARLLRTAAAKRGLEGAQFDADFADRFGVAVEALPFEMVNEAQGWAEGRPGGQ